MTTSLRILPALLIAATSAAAAQWTSVGAVDSVRVSEDHLVQLFAANSVTAIRALSVDCIRVRFVPGTTRLPPDFSWAVMAHTWPPVEVVITQSAETLRLTTPEVIVSVSKRPLRISLLDRSGHPILRDHPAKGMAWCGSEVRTWKSMPPDERYFGFGEKSGKFDRTGTAMSMWNSDIPAYTADTDPLYQTIPFFYGLCEGKAYGIFFDNPGWTSFDMGKEARDQYSFGGEGGEMDYYFFQGPAPAKILGRFTDLVGHMPLPPLWSLGYQQCRWSYTPESRVREIASRFRAERIPCDVIYLDIDYMEGYRVFTWSAKNFPSPPSLLRDLARDGFKVITIIDPGIKVDSSYGVYRSGLAGNHFVRRRDGSVFLGDVWPGRCAFPDFARAATRTWWGEQFAPLVAAGVKGWWNDMNEPSVFNVPTKTIDLDATHQPDGGAASHAAVHNVYGMQMTRGTYEGTLRLKPDERPFVLTRATYAGGHRYAAAWTGDNVASWEHLHLALKMCLNLSVSGQPFVGADIGGFIGYPSGELFARWLQLGVFTPLMRAHSAINEKNKEPWEYGPEFTAINRETIRLRYRLIPYLYGLMEQASRTGLPVMRPLIFEDPSGGPGTWDDTEFFCGPDMLVAPVLRENARSRDVYLPPGDWFDFWTAKPLQGGRSLTTPAPLSRIPLYVRAGAVIPTQQDLQYTGESPVNPLTLCIYPPASSLQTARELYEDDGISFRYRKGEFQRRQVRLERTSRSIVISLPPPEGSFQPADRAIVLRIASPSGKPQEVRIGGVTLPWTPPGRPPNVQEWTFDTQDSTIIVRARDVRTDMTCVIRY
jgi:alpha-glucosidase